MSKDSIKGISLKPFRFVREVLGAKKVQIQEGTHIFRLGKECVQCRKSIIHRDAISVCQCYCFAHKDCLKNQLKQTNLTEFSVVECRDCKGRVNVRVDSEYFFKINISIGDLIVLFICAALCAASMVYLVNFKNAQRQEIRQEELRTHRRPNASLMTIEEVIPVTILFISGSLFWLCLIGMILNKTAIIKDVIGTNSEVKVSAFEQIQSKIRQQSQQQIVTKKPEIDL